MLWRAEGDSTEPPPLLQMGTRVKARWRGGEQYHAGRILGLNLDGTYKVDYADNQLELSVAREFFEVVELEAQVELSEEEGEADDGEVGVEVGPRVLDPDELVVCHSAGVDVPLVH